MEEAHTISIIVLICHENLTESCLQVLIFDVSKILDLPHILDNHPFGWTKIKLRCQNKFNI